jgi:predicted dehydrogenase/6-phosphogluconolactonase/glucosamine-6-phosphate isomerase/deaminase
MSPVRFGLIGYGAWGRHHAAAIAKTPGAELLAIAAISEESRAAARKAHPHVAVYGDYRELLERHDIDIVDVVVPNYLHFSVAKAALEAGKHVLLEKPMATTSNHCRELITAARAKEKLLAIGFEMRLSELWGRVKSMIDAGAIGEPRYALIELWRRPYRQGSQDWRYDLNRVGNWVLEEPIHFFDLACWCLGEPISVFASASSKQPDHPELQDNFVAMLGFRGAQAVVAQSLSAWGHHQTVKVAGTNGALWASWSGATDRDPRPVSSLKHFDGKTVHEIPLERPTGELFELEDEIAAVVQAVRRERPPPATGEDGLRAVALCEAAQRSITVGKVVSLSSDVEAIRAKFDRKPSGSGPDYLRVPPGDLGKNHTVQVRVLTDTASIAEDMARSMLDCIQLARNEGRKPTLIVPVGPVDQYPVLARLVNAQRFSLQDVVFINMDEYLMDDGEWVPLRHPLSFRGFMDRQFYGLLDPELCPPPENRVFPDPHHLPAVGRLIETRGGVDACFGGIGINGHIAFNEPPESGDSITVDDFAALPTRVLPLARETRTINSVTVGGEISVVPPMCITVGMKEILASRRLRFYCNRPWQAGVVRRALHGPISPACPASYLRTHPDAWLTLADYVAALPDIRLR